MAVRSSRQSILVVATDLAVRRSLSAMLAGAGYDVLTVQDGSGAVSLAQEHNFDLVITDLSRPPEASAEMMRAIRDAQLLVKTLAIADVLSPEALKAADLLGAQGVVTIPLAAQNVVARVRELLQRRPAVY
jgi:DNA-binding response OmpR family regulator